MVQRRILLVLCVAFSWGVGLAPAAAADPVGERFEASFIAEGRGDFAKALNEVLEILRKDPSDYVATLRAGWLYHLKGQAEDAIVTYRKAMALQPVAVEAKLGLMLPLMAMGRWKETADVCAQVLKTAPGDYTALSRLAYAQYNLGLFAEAARSYEQVLALYPSDIEMMLGLGWAQVKLGQRDKARLTFGRVLQIRRGNLRAQAGLEACGP